MLELQTVYTDFDTLLCQIKTYLVFSTQKMRIAIGHVWVVPSLCHPWINARLSPKPLIWKLFMFDSHANKTHNHTWKVLPFASFWKWDSGTQKWPIHLKSVSFLWKFDRKIFFRVNVTWDNCPLALDVKRCYITRSILSLFLWWWSNKGVCFQVPVHLNIHSFLTIFRILFWPSALPPVFSHLC